MAIGLIIAGVVIIALSFIVALVNMAGQAKNVFSGKADDAFSGFGGMFARHIGAMIGVVIGGLTFSIGVVLEAIKLIPLLLK